MTEQTAGAILEFTIGDRLRKARENMDLDQGPFAALVGVSRGTVSNYEREEVSHYKPIVLREWARVAEVNLHWLETGEGNPSDPNPPGQQGDGDQLRRLTEAKARRAHRRHGENTGRYLTPAVAA